MPGTYTIADYKEMMKKARSSFAIMAECQRQIYTSEEADDIMASHAVYTECLNLMIQRLQKAAAIYQDLSDEDRLLVTNRLINHQEEENPS